MASSFTCDEITSLLKIMCIDWTVASVIVSAIMAIATFWSIYESRRQFNEMKRQWAEDNRPRLIISVISTDEYFMFKVENVGNDLARNVKFKFNEFLKEKLVSQSSCNYFRDIENKVYHLSPGASKHFLIISTFGFDHLNYPLTGESITEIDLRKWVDANLNESINVSCNYWGGIKKTWYSEVLRMQIKDLYNNAVRVIDDEVGALLAINTTLRSALKYYKDKAKDKKVGL